MSTWKERSMSMGGKVVIINAVLNVIPSYMLSFYKALVKVLKELIQIQSKFLWGGVAQKNFIHWVSWEKVCLPKDKEGLGVKNIELFNISLFMKWEWRTMNDRSSIWSSLIGFRYCAFGFPLLSIGFGRGGIEIRFVGETYQTLVVIVMSTRTRIALEMI